MSGDRENKDKARPTAQPTSGKPQVRSLGVLYLRNLGAEEDEFLSYGITEDLIIDLSRLGTLRVAPLRAVLKFKDSDLELPEIAAQLDVSLLLDGSIHRAADSVRASAQLVDISSGEILWADRWEEPLYSLPHIKEALAAGVAGAINVETVAAQAVQLGHPETTNPHAYEFYLRGKYAFDHRQSAPDLNVAVEHYRQALDLEPSMLAARTGLAEIMLHAGQPEQAGTRLLNTLAEARRKHLRADEARTLRLLARTRFQQSRWDEAAAYAEQAIAVSKELGDLVGEAANLGILIDILQRRAGFTEALGHAERVLEINRQLCDQEQEADALNKIGTVHLFSGDCERASRLYNEALAIATKRDDLPLQARCIVNIGSAHVHCSEFSEARRLYEQALDLFNRLGDRHRQAITLNNLARTQIAVGVYREALDYYARALEIQTELGDSATQGLTLSNHAIVLIALGRYEEAEIELDQALDIALRLKYPLVEALARINLGQIQLCQGKISQAEKLTESALLLALQCGLFRATTMAHVHLGELYYLKNEPKKALENFVEAERLAKGYGWTQNLLKSRAYLVALRASSDNLEESISRLEEMTKNVAEYGDPAFGLLLGRLRGAILVELGMEDSVREQGLEVLDHALAEAERMGIAPEIKWISETRKRLTSRRSR